MTFTPNVPQGNQTLSETHTPIRNNFGQLNTQIGTEHVALTADVDNGNHKRATFNEVTADPALGALLFPRSRVYTKHQGIAPNRTTDLFFSTENEPGTIQRILQLTGIPLQGVAPNFGFTTPWGFTINYGTVVSNANNPVVVNFAVPFTASVGCVQLTPWANDGSRTCVVDNVVGPALNSFRVRSSNGGLVLYYFAIGI